MKNRFHLFSIILLASSALYLHSCKVKKPKSTAEAQHYTYNQDVQRLMSIHCVNCHSGDNPAAKLDLTTYAKVKDAAANKGLMYRMNLGSNPMPPNGKLSSDKLQIVKTWIKNGYPEG